MPGKAGAASNVEILEAQRRAMLIHTYLCCFFSSTVSQQAQKPSSGAECKRLIQQIEHYTGGVQPFSAHLSCELNADQRGEKQMLFLAKSQLIKDYKESIKKHPFLPR